MSAAVADALSSGYCPTSKPQFIVALFVSSAACAPLARLSYVSLLGGA